MNNNEDLFPQPFESPKDDIAMQKAFVLCELMILRRRDMARHEWDVFDELANDIHDLAKKWHGFNNKESSTK